VKYVPCRIKTVPQEDIFQAAEVARQINPLNAPALEALRMAAPDAPVTPEHLALLTSKYWGNAGVWLTVSFLDGAPPDVQQRILSHMNAWQQFCNVTFSLVPSGGDVRIARAVDGYWSYVGTDIKIIPAEQPTMNLESFSMSTPESEYHRVVRHETGHTLGFPHEHMRSQIVARIDNAKAIAFFGQPPNNWTPAEVTAQVLTPLNNSALTATQDADVNSIMCYSLPAQIMKDGVAVPGGTDIDATDAQFAASVYPGVMPPTPTPTPTPTPVAYTQLRAPETSQQRG
jgi:hypothetical protein